MKSLSIIIPVYNEENTVITVLERIFAVQFHDAIALQVVLVNDFSTDNTVALIRNYIRENNDKDIRLIEQPKNMGKGACIIKAIAAITGEVALIQDADLEYHPNDYPVLLSPIISGDADVVFGSRFISHKPHRVLFFWHSMGNKLITFLSNVMTNLNLTDVECGYKVFNSRILKQFELKEQRFGIEPELVAKTASLPGIRIYEVGVSYYGRTYAEGKKIGLKDGFRALYCILKYRFF